MSATRRRTSSGATVIDYNRRQAFGLTEPDPLPQNTVVLRHRGFGPEISQPCHGATGWTEDGERVIFAKSFTFLPTHHNGVETVHVRQGWYLEEKYRVLKVVCTGRIDWRVATLDMSEAITLARLAQEAEERRRMMSRMTNW